MPHQKGKEKFLASIVKVNTYSLVLATLTGIATNLITGIFSFLIYLHFLASLPHILGLEKFSAIEICQKLADKFPKK
jgi:hypothetical protein